ncbi:MAG: hypothetical protein NC311_02520 [Muribaculaceae bacterium]|nr:hypothetical protein [Muribaculaceae bacterium]
MKITKIMCTVIFTGFITSANSATQCEIKSYNNDCDSYGIMGDTKGCSNYVHKCYYFNAGAYRHLIDCTSCKSGYTLKTQHPTDNCSGTISYGVCESTGSGGDYGSCTWVACTDYGNPKEEKCVYNNRDYGYRCKVGTYNMGKTEPTNCTWSCGTCPGGGTSDAGNNMGITSCYLTPGTYSGATGIYELTGNCYYKE